MNTDIPTKLQLLEALFKKYKVDYQRLLDNTGGVRKIDNRDYVSVGGDLNNITLGKALVETRDRNGTPLSMGINPGADVTYDKIVIL